MAVGLLSAARQADEYSYENLGTISWDLVLTVQDGLIESFCASLSDVLLDAGINKLVQWGAMAIQENDNGRRASISQWSRVGL